MKKYDVHYSYRMEGVVEIEANTMKEARQLLPFTSMDCEKVASPYAIRKVVLSNDQELDADRKKREEKEFYENMPKH